MTRDPWTVLLDRQREMIAEHGVSVVGVFPRADDPDPGMPFAYTAGLTAVRCPELIAVGMDVQGGYAVLNDLGRRVVAGERGPYSPGERLDDPFGTGYAVGLLDAVVLEEYPPNVTRSLYPDVATFLQVIWPTSAYLWPWQDGADYGGKVFPLLGPVPDEWLAWDDTPPGGHVVTTMHPVLARALRRRLHRVHLEAEAGRWVAAHRLGRVLPAWTAGTPAEGSTRRLVATLHRRALGESGEGTGTDG